MSAPTPDRDIGLMEGPAALPRRNGELVFEAPWEGRVFGLAVAMTDRRHYHWDDFRDRLVAEIAEGDAAGAASAYYERWLAAFESLLLARGLVTAAELEARTAACAAEPEDDHDHDGHDHHHDEHDRHHHHGHDHHER
ncbi:MAG TPA: nitrile hydratase accessory protein [Chloroflexota bacterium]|jgi:nitrile hydratase accessory protein